MSVYPVGQIIRLGLRNLFLLSGLLMLFLFGTLNAQNNVPKYTLNISYYGNNILNPGFNVGLDYTHGVENGSNRKGSEYTRQKFYNLDAGFYINPGKHAGLLLHSGFNHRKFRENKLNMHIGGSPIGIYRSFFYETTEVSDDGSESGVKHAARYYYAPTLSLGLGKFWKNVPGTGWLFEIDLVSLIPHNYYPLIHVNTRLGLRIRLDK